MKEASDSIARRAYEIFETSGKQFGRDWENWFRAEKELFHPVHLDVNESAGIVSIRVEVPGFTAKELEINVEPRHLTIAGNRESTKEQKKGQTVYSERCSSRLFRSVELPAEVDADKAIATLKDGILQLTLPKAATAKKFRIEPKVA